MLEDLAEIKARWSALAPLTQEVERRIDHLLEAPYVAASNLVEDRHALGLEETEVFLEQELTSAGRRLEDFVALERHRDALREVRARARAGAPLSLDLIRSLHLELTHGLKDKDYAAGEWKTRPGRAVTRRGRPFRYASPEQVPDLMRDLVAGYESLAPRVAPLEAITWFAYHFHLIHPFNEANGRIQRLVTSFLLLKAGYRELVIEPRDRQAYLSALAACDSTVPADKLAPLYAGIGTGTLVEFFASCVARTIDGLLATLEGREARQVADVARASGSGQRALLIRLKTADPELAWRHEAAGEVRRLQDRLEATLAHAKDEGPLYTIEPEPAKLRKDHDVDELVRPGLPSGGASVIGIIALTIRPNATAPVNLPAPRRFVAAVAASRLGLQLVTRWAHEPRPVSRSGPPLASSWSQGALERYLAERIDTARREYDAEILELNRGSKGLTTAFKGMTTRRKTLASRLLDDGKARGEEAPRPRKRTPSGRLANAAPPLEDFSDEKPGRSKLGGIRPAEPPVSI